MRKLSVMILFLLATSHVFAADAPAKEAVCRACHGVNGAAPIAPNYPKLNGQNKAYLVDSLKAYKAKNRNGGLAAVMIAQAQTLTDAEIDALATYYSTQK